MHSLTPQRLKEILANSEALQQLSAPARERLEWISRFVLSGQTISETCEEFGIARSTFHRWLERFDPQDLSTLEEKPHDALNLRTPVVPAKAVELIRAYRQQDAYMGKEQISKLLMEEHGMTVSCSTVGRVIERECLYFGTTPLHWRKRMQREQRAEQRVHVPVITQATVMPTASGHKVEEHEHAHDCAHCRSWKFYKKAILKSLALTSVLANVAIAVMFFATLMLEHEKKPETAANILESEHITSVFDYESDGR
jgi:transposase-like protein